MKAAGQRRQCGHRAALQILGNVQAQKADCSHNTQEDNETPERSSFFPVISEMLHLHVSCHS